MGRHIITDEEYAGAANALAETIHCELRQVVKWISISQSAGYGTAGTIHFNS